jgi:YVTN family beta-propeller protein
MSPVSTGLYEIDLATGTIAATVEVGTSPSGVAVTPDGALIVTADRDDNQISIIDAKTFARKGTVKVGAHPFGVTIGPIRRMSKAMTCPSSISRVETHWQRGGRQAALRNCPREGARLFDRPIWRNGFGLRSCDAAACEAGFRWRITRKESRRAPTATVFTSSIGSRTKSGRSIPRRSP